MILWVKVYYINTEVFTETRIMNSLLYLKIFWCKNFYQHFFKILWFTLVIYLLLDWKWYLVSSSNYKDTNINIFLLQVYYFRCNIPLNLGSHKIQNCYMKKINKDLKINRNLQTLGCFQTKLGDHMVLKKVTCNRTQPLYFLWNQKWK